MAKMGVGVCLVQVLDDHLKNGKQIVKLKIVSSETLDITSGVPQGSLLDSLLFCIVINDLHDVLRSNYPYNFADNLNVLSIRRGHDQLKADLDAKISWITENKTGLAMDKSSKIHFRGYK